LKVYFYILFTVNWLSETYKFLWPIPTNNWLNIIHRYYVIHTRFYKEHV